jgi:hypothetical protein
MTDVDATTVWYDTGTFTTLSEATAKGACVGTVDVGASDPNAVVTIGPPTALAATDLPTSTVSLTGLVPYGVTNVASGATLTITVVVSGTLAPTTVLRKSGGVFSDITSQATISGQVVTFSVTDGGAGDGDGLTSGRHLSARASGTCSVEVVKAATAIYSSVTSDPLLFTFHF